MPTGHRRKVLLEDNHECHGHAPGSPLHQFKRNLGIKYAANIKTSPDLNAIEKIWRVLKQRVKAKGHPRSIVELKRWILAEWEGIEQDLINRYIDDMPLRVRDICRRGGRLLRY